MSEIGEYEVSVVRGHTGEQVYYTDSTCTENWLLSLPEALLWLFLAQGVNKTWEGFNEKIPALACICNGRMDRKKTQTIYGNDDQDWGSTDLLHPSQVHQRIFN